MKKTMRRIGWVFITLIFVSAAGWAQEKEVEKTVKVLIEKDGKVVMDTTYVSLDDDKKVEKLLKKYKGDVHKEMNVMIYSDGDSLFSVLEGHEMSKHINITKDGNYVVAKAGSAVFMDEDGKTNTFTIKSKEGKGEEMEEHIIIMSGDDGEKKEHRIKIISNVDECEKVHDCAEVHVCDEIEVAANIMVLSGDKSKPVTWVSKDHADETIVVEGVEIPEMGFFMDSDQQGISLKSMGDDQYRLVYESDILEPITIEVVNGEGKRMFRQKVRKFYGKYMKDIELDETSPRFYTVVVKQGDFEEIGKFQFK